MKLGDLFWFIKADTKDADKSIKGITKKFAEPTKELNRSSATGQCWSI